MENLSEDDVKLVHREPEKEFPLMPKCIAKKGLIQATIEKQSMTMYLGKSTDVYTPAAVPMEAITRWRTFHDGNKRTGLLCAFLYLYQNKHSGHSHRSVRLTQKIDATEGAEPERAGELIAEVAARPKEPSSSKSEWALARIRTAPARPAARQHQTVRDPSRLNF